MEENVFVLEEVVEGALVDENGFVKAGVVLDLKENDVVAAEIFTERFYAICRNFLEAVDKERGAQGIDPYSDTQKIVMAVEFAREFVRARDMKRANGDGVAEGHWSVVPEVLAGILGVTGLSSMLAALCHDILEDCASPRDFPDLAERTRRIEALSLDLIGTDFYEGLIDDFSHRVKRTVGSELASMVAGMTKVKATTREETTQRTFEHMAKVLIDHLRTVMVKIADRIANLRTLTFPDPETGEEIPAFKDPEKHLKICRETMRIYVEMSKVLRTRDATREMVYWCVHYLNPKLERDFDLLSKEKRPSKRVRNYEALLFEKLEGLEGIEDLQVRSKDISEYLLRGRRRDLEVTELDDLKIHAQDPMEEVVLLIDGLLHGRERAHKIRDALRAVVDRYEHEEHPGRYRFVSNQTENDGLTAIVYNPDLGGWISLRVNDQWSEARLKRGVLFHREQSEDVAALQLDIQNSLVLAASNSGINFVKAAQKEIFGETFDVFTPQGEVVKLKAGETGLDYVRKVHSQFLAQADYLVEYGDGDFVHKQGEPVNSGRRVDLYEELTPGKVYLIVKKKKDLMTPEFYLFAGREGTKDALRQLFKKYTKKNKLEVAQNYLRKLEDVFGLERGMLRKRMMSGVSGKVLEARWLEVVSGRLDPLETLVDILGNSTRLVSGAKRDVICRYNDRSVITPTLVRTDGKESEPGTSVVEDQRRALGRGLQSMLARGGAGYETLEVGSLSKITVRVILDDKPGVLSAYTGDFEFEGRQLQIIDLKTSRTPQESSLEQAEVYVSIAVDSTAIGFHDLCKFLIYLNHKYGAEVSEFFFNEFDEGGSGSV